MHFRKGISVNKQNQLESLSRCENIFIPTQFPCRDRYFMCEKVCASASWLTESRICYFRLKHIFNFYSFLINHATCVFRFVGLYFAFFLSHLDVFFLFTLFIYSLKSWCWRNIRRIVTGNCTVAVRALAFYYEMRSTERLTVTSIAQSNFYHEYDAKTVRIRYTLTRNECAPQRLRKIYSSEMLFSFRLCFLPRNNQLKTRGREKESVRENNKYLQFITNAEWRSRVNSFRKCE